MAGIELPWEGLEFASRQFGIPLVGATRIPTLPFYESTRLRVFQESGFAGQMEYLNRPAAERCDFTFHQPWARTLLVFAFPYTSANTSGSSRPPESGRVARYAWGRDYHRTLKRILSSFRTVLSEQFGVSGFDWRPIADSYPIMERAFAEQAGYGFRGKNGLIIQMGSGSYFFLAEVLTDLDVIGAPRSVPSENSQCGSCTRCQDQCPTGAFHSPYVLNATRCISYLTIEKKGVLHEWERKALGDWIFGCDICQEVCPFNHKAMKFPQEVMEAFRHTAGVGEFIEIHTLLEIRSSASFVKRFAGTPLLRAGRESLLRNALCVAVNAKYYGLIAKIQEAATSDSSLVVRQTAYWALQQLSQGTRSASSSRKLLEASLLKESDLFAKGELERLIDNFNL
ncbi:MAG: tRNA epoxyqueuosine(34) reductase QueG [Bdellovibrionales bacterium]|nr:tRNA epoxyqueuosine(34) reductase QueG [Bdellovibrionales bacterium]